MIMDSVPQDIKRRMAGLYETIRSAESSLSIASWIADHRDEVSCLGYGPLFQHLQYMAYVDYVVTTVALFDPNTQSNSVRNLWELIQKIDQEQPLKSEVFQYIESIKSQFPRWSKDDEDVETLTGILTRLRYKRDKVIAHRELLKDYSAPKASIEIIDGGCKLLSFATEIYDFTATLISYPYQFRITRDGTEGLLPHVRDIARQLEAVVSGEFAQKKKERGLI